MHRAANCCSAARDAQRVIGIVIVVLIGLLAGVLDDGAVID